MYREVRYVVLYRTMRTKNAQHLSHLIYTPHQVIRINLQSDLRLLVRKDLPIAIAISHHCNMHSA